MTLPKAVFFDWDGTLVETLDFLHAAHNHVRGHFNMPLWTLDEYKIQMKHSAKDLYPKLYGNRTQEAMDVLAVFVEANHLTNLKLCEGALDILNALHVAGIPMGVVSNKRQAFLEREITHLGWNKYFQAIVGAGIAANDKPSGDPLVLALSKAGLTPGAEILYIGDTETDLLCATAAGCRTAFLYFAQPDNPLIQKHKPAVVAANCRDLATALFPPVNKHKYSP